jgi:Fe-S cluster assembly protein SufD
MSVLLESLTSAFDGEPNQRVALDEVLRTGLPVARNEAWKYTSLRALERRSFAAQTAERAAVDSTLLADIPAPRLVFVNGRYDVSLSDYAGLGDGVSLQPLSACIGHDATVTEDNGDSPPLTSVTAHDAPFALLALALAGDGLVLKIDAGVRVAQPIAVVNVGAPLPGDIAWHTRHRITLGAGAHAAIVEHQLSSGSHAHLGNALTEIVLEESASLLHARVQAESDGATLFAHTQATLQRDASYRRVDLELGAGLSRHQLNVRLQGDAARVIANGVLLGTGRRQIDTRLGIEHLAPDTRCELLWRGLASGRSRCVFHGGIVIHAGADGANARLSNKNLLLSENAEIDTQPVLEIHADEVKAAHGATVGQLDPTVLFYLRSRGLSEAQARQLLTAAFCREVIAGIDVPTVSHQLDRALDRALSRSLSP